MVKALRFVGSHFISYSVCTVQFILCDIPVQHWRLAICTVQVTLYGISVQNCCLQFTRCKLHYKLLQYKTVGLQFARCKLHYTVLHYGTVDLQFALWKLYHAALWGRTVNFFEKKIYIYNLALSFYTRVQKCLQFQWCGGEIVAKWDDSHRESSHSLPIHFKQIRLTALLSRNFDFWNRSKSPIETLTTEQSFRHLHGDCTAETWLGGQQRYRNCSVQSVGLTVGWFQVLSAELLVCADGSGLVGSDAVPEVS
jgi:hypothetical protein